MNSKRLPPTSVNLSAEEKAEIKELGYPLRTLVKWGLERGREERARAASGEPVAPRATVAEIREMVAAEVQRRLGENGRLGAARKRSGGAVRHATPAHAPGTPVFQQPGGEPVAGAEVPVAADHGRKRGRAS
jgi:hypothetical protein